MQTKEGIDPEGAEDLPHLSAAERRFVQELLRGKNATDAYRLAHPHTRAKDHVLWVRACEERRKERVKIWLHAMRVCALAAGVETLEGHIAELIRLRELAIAKGQMAAAVQAEVHKGKVLGWYEDRLRLVSDTSDAELVSKAEQLLGNEAAHKLATALGCKRATKH
jgi:hypothetical protein